MRERITRVLHVVDRTTGGVPIAARSYIENSPEGFEHHVISPHSAAGVPAQVWEGADVRHHHLGEKMVARIQRVRRVCQEVKPDIVHAHSSFAGVYGRIAPDSRRSRIIYTPHGYSFMRTNTNKTIRATYWAIEWVLGWRTDLVASCSPGEAASASKMRSIRGRVDVVPNVASLETVPGHERAIVDRRLRIGMLGRVSAQKDPREFVAIAKRLRAAGIDVEPIWVGSAADSGSIHPDFSEVTVTGWLQGQRLVDTLANLDVYVHSAAWEGFPLAVLDAYVSGLPIVVRPIAAFGNLEEIQTTTYGLASLVRAAKTSADFSTWQMQNRAAWKRYLSENTSENQRRALARVWEPQPCAAKKYRHWQPPMPFSGTTPDITSPGGKI